MAQVKAEVCSADMVPSLILYILCFELFMFFFFPEMHIFECSFSIQEVNVHAIADAIDSIAGNFRLRIKVFCVKSQVAPLIDFSIKGLFCL